MGHTVDIVAREKGNLSFKVTTQEATGSYDNTPAHRRRAVEVRSTITPDHEDRLHLVVRGAIAELYFLSLVAAPHRMLVTTTESFLTFLQHELGGALATRLELVHVALPPI